MMTEPLDTYHSTCEAPTNQIAASHWLRAFISAMTIALLWAGWAVYINYEHGFEARVHAAIAQGSVSFSVAFFMSLLLEYFRGFFTRPHLRILVPVIATMSIVIVLTAIAHLLMKTPEIVNTMAFPSFMGTVYCTIYCLKNR